LVHNMLHLSARCRTRITCPPPVNEEGQTVQRLRTVAVK
jgi:hypothetical protein